MERDIFEQRLLEVGRRAVRIGRQYVLQRLPDEFAFRVYPNQSYDGNSRLGDEVVFPNETLPDGEFLGPWSVE